jgi:hypothetical protein
MTTRALYVIGPPGVGKTTAVLGFVRGGWTLGPAVTAAPLITYRPLLVGQTGLSEGMYLGDVREKFSGTDALSMAALPKAKEWVRRDGASWSAREDRGAIIGEGQRLANDDWLAMVNDVTELTVLSFDATDEALDERCAVRGTGQNLSWRKAATTRARNLTLRLARTAVDVVQVDATDIDAAAMQLAVAKAFAR